MKKELNVLYQSDNNYAEITGVSMVSLFENNKHLDEINVYILNDNIEASNLEKMKLLCEQYNRKFIIVNTKKIFERLKELKVTPYKGSYITYFRLMAIKDLEISTDRILQIDGDTLVRGKLDELIEMNLDGHIGAATYDCIMNGYKPLVGIDPNDKYYNAGVFLINQKYWKENNCEDQIIKHLKTGRTSYYIADQDISNVLFRDKVKYLSLDYNFNSGFYIYGIKESLKMYDLKPAYYCDIEEITRVSKNPKIIHCMGAMTGRPWEKDSIHPQNELFDKYLLMTPWKDFEKKVVNRNVIFKIQRKMYQILPKSIYIPIHKMAQKKYLNDMNKNVQKAK